MNLRRALCALVLSPVATGLLTLAAVPASADATTTAHEAAAFSNVLANAGVPVTAEVRADNGSDLAVVQDTSSLPPASTQKIQTIGTALTVLGPDRTFSTTLLGTRPLPKPLVWKGARPALYAGNLVLVAGGDPSLRMTGLASLLAPLATSGVRTVLGGLWLDTSLFDRVRTAPGWKPEWLGTEVGPLSAFMLEENLKVATPSYLADPDMGNLQIIQTWLAARGISIKGGLHVGRPAGAVPARLGAWTSQPLSYLAQVTLRDSVNTWAEVLLKDVGAANGQGSTARGLQVVQRVVTAVGGAFGSASDGSGLSTLDAASADQEVSTVRALGNSPIGAGLLADLPVACSSGTLLHRLCGASGRVHAKTGTLDTAAALTGYVVDTTGNRLWFSVQVGGTLSGYARNVLIDRAVLALAGS